MLKDLLSVQAYYSLSMFVCIGFHGDCLSSLPGKAESIYLSSFSCDRGQSSLIDGQPINLVSMRNVPCTHSDKYTHLCSSLCLSASIWTPPTQTHTHSYSSVYMQLICHTLKLCHCDDRRGLRSEK